MIRRKFIKDTLTGLPLIYISPSLLASCAKNDDVNEETRKNIIIIGAGISGLAAAKKVKREWVYCYRFRGTRKSRWST